MLGAKEISQDEGEGQKGWEAGEEGSFTEVVVHLGVWEIRGPKIAPGPRGREGFTPLPPSPQAPEESASPLNP